VVAVLLVEDDAEIRTALTRALREHGHAVTALSSGLPALSAAVEQRPDVVVLDLGLPDVDGRDVLSMLRAVSDVPVIVATARDDEEEMVRVLDAGADDYVIKPFTAAQVTARIRAVLRRTGRSEEDPVITVGRLVVDTRSYEVTVDGRPIELARKEFELLLALARRAGKIHYFVADQQGFLGSTAGNTTDAYAIQQWVAHHYAAKTIGGSTVYDLASAR
jgi:DNA-binding response OmpR family regulator